MKAEEDMAAKKAFLLEKRLRREKETQEKKQQQEVDHEQKREAARSVSLYFAKHCPHLYGARPRCVSFELRRAVAQ